jgi:hypothetical protein
MLLPIYGFATTDTTQTNVVNAPYPRYSFWSNWELGVRGGISTPFALKTEKVLIICMVYLCTKN